MRNYQTELDVRGVSKMVVGVTETVTVIPRTTSQGMAHIGKPDAEWGWADLRDYVIHEIQRRFGSCPRKDPKVEYGIFNSFMSRWGIKAPAIARHAFETGSGVWKGEPVHIENFCKNSDAYFAQPIAERLIG